VQQVAGIRSGCDHGRRAKRGLQVLDGRLGVMRQRGGEGKSMPAAISAPLAACA